MYLRDHITTKIAIAIAVLSLSGCGKSFLDTRLDTQPTEQNIDGNYTSLMQLANTPYAYLSQRNEFAALDGNLFAAATDEAQQTNTIGDVYLFNNGNWGAFNNPDDRYNMYYSGIYAANYFLEYIDKKGGDYKALLAVNRDTITQESRTKYLNDVASMGWSIAEAHVLRAYYYFELIKRYGGVPLLTKTFSVNEKPAIAASSFQEVVEYIVTSVDSHVKDLQPNWKTSQFTNLDGRFNQGAALMLKARVLLYAASPLHNPGNDITKWQRAAKAAAEALQFADRMDDAGGKNALDNNYRNYFLGNNTLNSAETIMAIRYTASNDLERANYPIATPGGLSGVTPSENLVSAYEKLDNYSASKPYDNRDPRLGYTVVVNGSEWNNRTIDQTAGGTDDRRRANASRTGYYLKKFVNDNVNLVNNATNPHNWPLFRYGDLLLIYAEAMNEAYGPDQANGWGITAREAINKLRARPGVDMPAVQVSGKAELRTAIKHERQVELAFENHRYWDLIRWGDAATVLNKPIYGVTVTKTTSGTLQYETRQVQNRVFIAPKMNFYPFPQGEIHISGGTLIQNPGW
ncbi:RagB/SusD family nutrient uptake outer membrane protein [Sphingobacterium sp. R2]|uniref:RagB/SusD family nutrient uptake outer membrane protein n=1 Tax=Sphingobacterium sp. R2 TaxID=3112958 RepID=UPI00345CD75C